ncbi:hypothetical protein C0993_010989 [Termitomyces sp. T159_Od127]|nr:hypothetical protein C0993_010989 [Termitomyces sp. T159_Od127]
MSVADQAGKLIDDNSRTLAPVAVGSQVALMSVISVVTILAFNLLRPKNKVIYEPKVKYHVGNKPPPRISDSLLGWLPPLIHTKEPELLDKIGLDAVAFLRFNRLMRWLFLGVAGLTCAVLIPVNVTYNLKNVDAKKRDILSMLTIRDVGGNLLYVHVAVTYLITLMIIGIVHVHWKAMIKLRHAWFRSPEYLESFYARTLTITLIPKKNQSDEGLRAIFESTKVPYPTTSVHINRKVGKLPELIEYHNTTVREFEAVLVKYLKNGRLGKKRPTIRVGATCGIGGMKKDAIDFYTAKLQRTEAAIEEYRRQIDTRKAENYGFASMAAVPYAHIVAKMLKGKHPKGTKIELAPNPKDIIWHNMNKSPSELYHKKTIGFVWLAVVCFFNTVPLFVISILANLETLRQYVPFLNGWANGSPGTFAFVSGVLPPTISAVFGFFLPIIMRWLTKYMGALTHSKLDRAVIARYYSFLIISQLVIFTLIGVIFNLVRQIVVQIGKTALFCNFNATVDAIGLQYRFKSLQWLSTIPPILFIIAYKIYINRAYLPVFRYFMPTEEEIRLARVHSERADARGSRLQRRFGHPALHAELFTPMLHAKMMPLLSQVYHGRLATDEAKMEEYGGQKLEAQVVPGGIKIAAVSQNELMYDPALYQRDRGELDWDARSMTSTVLFDGTDSIKAPTSSKPPGYDQYLVGGIHRHLQSDIELTKMDTMQEPLLNSRDYYQQSQAPSQLSLSIPPSLYQEPFGTSREAPTHRPQERSYSPYLAGQSPAQSLAQSPELPRDYQSYQHLAGQSTMQQYPPRQASPYYSQFAKQDGGNMAGRGAHRM